jgi:DNA-binding NtrC family response regulator
MQRRLTTQEQQAIEKARATEADTIRSLMAIYLGSVPRAAASIGWPVRTLYARLRELGIRPADYRPNG